MPRRINIGDIVKVTGVDARFVFLKKEKGVVYVLPERGSVHHFARNNKVVDGVCANAVPFWHDTEFFDENDKPVEIR